MKFFQANVSLYVEEIWDKEVEAVNRENVFIVVYQHLIGSPGLTSPCADGKWLLLKEGGKLCDK